MNNLSILLVDDDVELTALMEEYFRGDTIHLAVAHNGIQGLNRALEGSFDLILLDVMLSGMEGFEVLRQLRRRSAVPVIMLTARTEQEDRIEGLNAGADDYLAKPFSPDELRARIQAVLRRSGRGAMLKTEMLEANGVRLHTTTRQVICDGAEVDVTSIEFDILELLVRSAGRVVSRDDLTRFLYNRQANPMERALDVHMSHLRKKLEPGRPLIRTVRGVGYLICHKRRSERCRNVGMRSIFVKILAWFAVTLAVCVAGLSVTNQWRNRFEPGRRDFFSRSLSLEASDAREAYETGGKIALAAYLRRLKTFMPGDRSLVDERGIDLLSGANRSAELTHLGPHFTPSDNESRMKLAWPTLDGKYRMIIDAPTPAGPWSSLPSYLWIGLAAVVFCYIVAVQCAGPLRTLEHTVERFGGGDLAVRAEVKRKDEFGKLAKAFNLMADRLETLLTAERRLLQDVSHELRSPLARLQFAVELARTNPDHGRSMDRIQKEIDRLSTLVSELLQVTRAENDPDSRNMEALDLRAVVDAVVEDNQMEADARRVELAVKTDLETVSSMGDRELLGRAVENVVRNAIRYAPEGSRVEISLVCDSQHVIIGVRDFGPGVPPDTLAHLFKPFFRAEPDRGRNTGGGVGLGLSIAERAIAVHHGQIRAMNAEPGLRVEIRLPVGDVRAVELAGVGGRA